MFQAVRGTRDIFSPLVEEYVRLEAIARRLAAQWGFGEIRIPTFEEAGLFKRGVGETTDIVEKEMYVFEDRGERQLALRPEGTASVVRSYVENNMHQKEKNCRLFYVANMFRAERPQAGRYREFEQVGFEVFGDPGPLADAEIITLAWEIFKSFGLSDLRLSLNSIGCPECRGPYREKLETVLAQMISQLCEDCQNRHQKNPLRCLDCKKCSEKVRAQAPAFQLCAACQAHARIVEDLLGACGLTFVNDPSLVRGLDYYTRTVFEISSPVLGSQSAVCGGGRYDGLVELLGGPATPATGFALGVDRVVEARFKEKPPASPPLKEQAAFLVFVKAGPKAVEYGFGLAQRLRQKGVSVFCSSATDSIKSQMRQAGKSGAKYALMIGDDEFSKKQVLLKNLQDSSQATLSPEEVMTRLASPC